MSEAAAGVNATSLQPVPGSGIQVLSYLQGVETTVGVTLNAVLVSLENFAVWVGKDAIVFMLIIGVLLFYTRLNTLLGKRLIEGGVIIGIFILFVLPYLTVAVAGC
jgi:hypothetical protein